MKYKRGVLWASRRLLLFLVGGTDEAATTPSPSGPLPSFFTEHGHNAWKCSSCLMTMTKRPREFLSLKSSSLYTIFRLNSSKLLGMREKIDAYLLKVPSVIYQSQKHDPVTSLTFAHNMPVLWNHSLQFNLLIHKSPDGQCSWFLTWQPCMPSAATGGRRQVSTKVMEATKCSYFGDTGARTRPGVNHLLTLCPVSEFLVCSYRER